jgi:hypothetical protein
MVMVMMVVMMVLSDLGSSDRRRLGQSRIIRFKQRQSVLDWIE